ncbi:MAG: hypothetical protein QXU45_03915 [Candidatus Bathyarchaeia archaeon]
MEKVPELLRDKKMQYVVIVWILLIKVFEIAVELLANIELLYFFELLGFGYLSKTSRMAWDALITFTIIWLIYRLAKDAFQISLGLRQLSKRELLSTILLLIWVAASVTAVLQFAQAASLPPASPRLEISRYYQPCNMTEDRFTTYFTINDAEQGAKITLDLSKSVFSNAFSFCRIGEISMFGVKDGGLSYFSLKDSQTGQKMIEMKFFGNGTNGLDGWFANKIILEKPLNVNENTTLILLLKLEPSADNTAWTYIKLDFSSENGEDYYLVWKFHDKPINSMLYSADKRMKTYLLGSAVEWTFFQFNLQNVFYTSFSSHPKLLGGIEYGVGAEADNTVAANFLLAKISDNPFKVNGELVESVKPTVKLDDSRICFEGVNVYRLYATSILKPCREEKHFQLFLTKISRLEKYKWVLPASRQEAEERIRLNTTNNSTKIFLNGGEVTFKTRVYELSVYQSETLQNEVVLTFINEIDTYLMPIISIFLIPPLTVCLWKTVKLKKRMKNAYAVFYF